MFIKMIWMIFFLLLKNFNSKVFLGFIIEKCLLQKQITGPNSQQKKLLSEEKARLAKTIQRQDTIDNSRNENEDILSTVDEALENDSNNTAISRKENSELEGQIKSMMYKEELLISGEHKTKWLCTVCGKSSDYKNTTRNHVQAHLDKIFTHLVKLICSQCGKVSKNKDAFVPALAYIS